ncbi:MAG TPA: hypothetical protein VNB22_05600 [Pyrinomonadaceae bacterium]|nr:hypothetical protein [Pyrinomonadaceae bacterium]
MKKVPIYLYIVLILSIATFGQTSSETVECKIDSNKKFKYNIVTKSRTLGEQPIFGMYVVIKDNKKYNKEDMLKFTENIKMRFCNEERISVVIFDDKKAIYSKVVTDYLLGYNKAPELRGFYSLDRKTNKEGIQFSLQRGNPTDEVKIDISK